jgi:hypothetical protein
MVIAGKTFEAGRPVEEVGPLWEKSRPLHAGPSSPQGYRRAWNGVCPVRTLCTPQINANGT